jgi:hypothetical protein
MAHQPMKQAFIPICKCGRPVDAFNVCSTWVVKERPHYTRRSINAPHCDRETCCTCSMSNKKSEEQPKKIEETMHGKKAAELKACWRCSYPRLLDDEKCTFPHKDANGDFDDCGACLACCPDSKLRDAKRTYAVDKCQACKRSPYGIMCRMHIESRARTQEIFKTQGVAQCAECGDGFYVNPDPMMEIQAGQALRCAKKVPNHNGVFSPCRKCRRCCRVSDHL